MAGFRGDFVWYEIMTTDTQGAQDFYTKVVGWTTQPFEAAGMPYTVLNAGEAGVGGVMELPQPAREMGAPPHWLAYVGVENADETAALVRELGGQVYMDPMDIPTVGRVAIVADPQGAVIGLYTPETASGEATVHEGNGHFCWHELWTSEPEKGLNFYTRVFGWNKTSAMDMGPQGVYQMYGLGEKSLGGVMKKPDQMPMCAWMYYIDVNDLDGSLARVKELGGQVVNGPMEIPGGFRVAHCMDPQGAAFALHGK